MPTTGADLKGGCLCGTVRYRLTAQPFGVGWCHCRTCQRNSGSPAMVFASVPVDDYLIEQGSEKVRRYRSSEKAERWFCGECGTPLLFSPIDGATRDFSLATLDDPAAVVPEFHIYYDSRIAWAEAAEGLPRFPRGRHG
jgi:hypothetical protein